jgi:hypothetical protein
MSALLTPTPRPAVCCPCSSLTPQHSVLSGLLLACDYEAGQVAMSERSYAEYPDFFAPLFEVTRRYKVMNPEKMRDTYGKLVYMLQDANTPDMLDELGFSVWAPIKTVHERLKEAGALAMLGDDSLATATQVVTPDPGKSRAQIQREIKQKEAAIEHLSRKYRSRSLPDEELKQCLYSISDNNAYLYQVPTRALPTSAHLCPPLPTSAHPCPPLLRLPARGGLLLHRRHCHRHCHRHRHRRRHRRRRRRRHRRRHRHHSLPHPGMPS